jgi:uncharacterized membrane protein
MNWAYFHMLINHFPITGIFIGTLLLLAGILYRNQGVQISGLGIVVFSGITFILAYLSGDPAKDAMKGLPEVAQSLVNRHEDIATVGMYLLIPAVIMAALSLYSIWKKERSVQFLIIITLILSLVSLIALFYVGQTGGQIRHNEFRSDSSRQYILEHQKDKVNLD